MMEMKKIRVRNESIQNISSLILFVILWYGLLFRLAMQTFSVTQIVFYIGGLLPLLSIVQVVKKASFYRKQRQQIIQTTPKINGTISEVLLRKGIIEEGSGNGQRARVVKSYTLAVKIYDAEVGDYRIIESQPYNEPIHHYIADPSVSVYYDARANVYYIEDIIWKKHRKEPDVIDGPIEYEDGSLFTKLYKTLPKLILVIFILEMLFQLI